MRMSWKDFRFVIFTILLCLLIGLVIPYFLLLLITAVLKPQEYSCVVNAISRIPCVIGGTKPLASDCKNAGCCWDASTQLVSGTSAPNCFHSSPSRYDYQVANYESNSTSHQLRMRTTPVSRKWQPFGQRPLDLQWDVQAVTGSYVKIVGRRVEDDGTVTQAAPIWDDFEPVKTETGSSEQALYRVLHSRSGDRFTLDIVRHSSNASLVLFDEGPLVLTETYVEFNVRLPSANVYGLGEYPHTSLRRNMTFSQGQLLNRLAREAAPNQGRLYYGTHPFYMCLEPDGKAHGVLLGLDQPTDVAFQPGPSISFRSSGPLIELHIFVGPTPKEVLRQYTAVIGRPFLIPYWALGYHTCRSYGNTTISENVIAGLPAAGIPHESDCGDALLLRSLSQTDTASAQTYNSLASVANKLKNSGRMFLLHQGPLIAKGSSGASNQNTAFSQGSEERVFIRQPNGTGFYFGLSDVYLSGSSSTSSTSTVLYPDFSHPNTSDWMRRQYGGLGRQLAAEGIDVQGMFLVDHTPIDVTNKAIASCPTRSVDDQALPPVSEFLQDATPDASDTVCLNALHYDDALHYTQHNRYGLDHTRTVAESVVEDHSDKSRRIMMASLSTFPGSGSLSGHWGGEYDGSWSALKASVVQMLEFNFLYGVPMTGAPICGYRNDQPATDVCWRWMQLGPFYPLVHTYYGQGVEPREPIYFGLDFQSMAADVLRLRHSLLPYFYTQFYNAHVHGDPVVRPLLYEFPRDDNVLDNGAQFLWGSGLLVSPTLNPDFALAYFPAGVWYEFQTHRAIRSENGTLYNLMPSQHFPNLHIRGGSVIVTQRPSDTTTSQTRLNDYTILVALTDDDDDAPGGPSWAWGELYLDDGLTANASFIRVEFWANDTSFGSAPVFRSAEFDASQIGASVAVEGVSIMGLTGKPIRVYMTSRHGNETVMRSIYDGESGSMLVNVPNGFYNLTQEFTLKWDY